MTRPRDPLSTAFLAGAATVLTSLATACGGSGLTASPAAAGGLSPSATSTAEATPVVPPPAPSAPAPTPPPGAVSTQPAAGGPPTAAAPAPATSPSPASGTSAAGPSAGAPAPLASVFGGDGASVQRLYEDATRAPPAALREKGVVADDPMAQGIREMAKKSAAGMAPEGALAVGVLREKQNLQTDVTLQPGRCYAIVGYSKRVQDLDLYLLLPPGILSAQDTTDDNTPLIGGDRRPICSVASVPITYKLSIVAERGAGEVAVQLYAKAR